MLLCRFFRDMMQLKEKEGTHLLFLRVLLRRMPIVNCP